MKTVVAIASVAILAASCSTSVSAVQVDAPRGVIVDDADAGWTWSSMTTYEDIGLAKGTGHAGGPGSYGVYTFEGTGIDIYAKRCSSVNIDGRTHRVGKLKISIDGHEKAEVSLAATADDFNVDVFSVSGLPSKLHVLQVEPESGWAVVDYIKIGADAEPVDPTKADGKVDGPVGDLGPLFVGKSVPLVAVNAVEARNNVVGFNSDINPELQVGDLPSDWGFATIYAHSGTQAVRYSGSSTGGPAFCYMYAYSVKLPVSSNTWLNYWILPQQDNGRYVAVDLHCTDGTSLSGTGAVDVDGIAVAPANGHGGTIPLYAWSPVRCHIGEWLAGKTIDKIWIGYSRPTAGGQYRGYIDDLYIDNEKANPK